MTRKVFLLAIGAVCAWFGGIASSMGIVMEKTEPKRPIPADESSAKRKTAAARALGRSSINNH